MINALAKNNEVPRPRGPSPETAARYDGLEARFQDEIAGVEPFNPVSRDDFLERFVDVPMHVHEAVYKEAFARALAHAESQRTPEPGPSRLPQDFQAG